MLRRISTIVIFLALCFGSGSANFGIFQVGLVPGNGTAGIGTNLTAVAYYQPNEPFANIMVMGNTWYTFDSGFNLTNEENELCLDANGWPTTLANKQTSPGSGVCTGTPTFTQVSLTIFNGLTISPYYQAGTYDLYYPSGCTWAVSRDGGNQTTISPGHDQFTVVTPGVTGILLTITAIGVNGCSGSYATYSGNTAAYQTQCIGGNYGPGCFNPQYLKYLAGFGAVRFMDWMCTNSNKNSAGSTWATRPTPAMPFYGSGNLNGSSSDSGWPIPCGVSVELMVAMANAGNWDMWVNMPTLAGNTYVTNFANYVFAHLNPNLHVYIEYANETWNFGFAQYTQLVTLGTALWPTPCGTDGYLCNRAFMGMQTQNFCNLWKTAFSGSTSRVKCVLGGFAAAYGQSVDASYCVYNTNPITINSGTYNSGTGVVSLTLASSPGLSPKDAINVSSGMGTGSVSSINGSFAAGTGTSGTTVNYTIGTGLTLTISGGTFNPGCTHGLDYVAIAPYFGCNGTDVPNTWVVNDVFTAINTGGNYGGDACTPTEPTSGASLLAQSSAYEIDHTTNITSVFGMPVVFYESGQSFLSGSVGALTSVFVSANSDSRMGTAYTNYWTTARSNNVQLMMNFADIGAWGSGGTWGLEQSICGDNNNCAAPTFSIPKYSATIAWIAANPCNGTNCPIH